jgi:hypothetical protein
MSRMELPFPRNISQLLTWRCLCKRLSVRTRGLGGLYPPCPESPRLLALALPIQPRPLEFTAAGEVEGGLSWQAEEPHTGV